MCLAQTFKSSNAEFHAASQNFEFPVISLTFKRLIVRSGFSMQRCLLIDLKILLINKNLLFLTVLNTFFIELETFQYWYFPSVLAEYLFHQKCFSRLNLYFLFRTSCYVRQSNFSLFLSVFLLLLCFGLHIAVHHVGCSLCLKCSCPGELELILIHLFVFVVVFCKQQLLLTCFICSSKEFKMSYSRILWRLHTLLCL